MICTSTLLRASTSLSAGFALASQRSPPFGSASRHSTGLGRSARGSAFAAPSAFQPGARGAPQLLDPCFETGGARRPPIRSRQVRHRAPFWTPVSRLLSVPRGLLFNFRSRYSLRYRTRTRIQPWGSGTPRIRATRSSSATVLQMRRGHRALTASRRPFQDRSPLAHRSPAITRARLLPFRSPLLRESRLLSLPGLTDMLKFGPWSHIAEGRLLGSVNRPRLSEQGVAAPQSARLPCEIRKVTIRIGL